MEGEEILFESWPQIYSTCPTIHTTLLPYFLIIAMAVLLYLYARLALHIRTRSSYSTYPRMTFHSICFIIFFYICNIDT